jgi:hypothetical protein
MEEGKGGWVVLIFTAAVVPRDVDLNFSFL